MCRTSSAGNSSLRSTPAATADATAGSRWVVAYLLMWLPRRDYSRTTLHWWSVQISARGFWRGPDQIPKYLHSGEPCAQWGAMVALL